MANLFTAREDASKSQHLFPERSGTAPGFRTVPYGAMVSGFRGTAHEANCKVGTAPWARLFLPVSSHQLRPFHRNGDRSQRQVQSPLRSHPGRQLRDPPSRRVACKVAGHPSRIGSRTQRSSPGLRCSCLLPGEDSEGFDFQGHGFPARWVMSSVSMQQWTFHSKSSAPLLPGHCFCCPTSRAGL
jgi:hypothetical protein